MVNLRPRGGRPPQRPLPGSALGRSASVCYSSKMLIVEHMLRCAPLLAERCMRSEDVIVHKIGLVFI